MSTKRPPIDWDTQPLGQVTDSELGARLGVSGAAVGAQRKKRGIPRYWRPEVETMGLASGVDWDSQPLGIESDSEIARRLGVSQSAVTLQRAQRGIPACGDGVDWDAQPLGSEPDTQIAQRLGVDPKTVAARRHERGIPPATHRREMPLPSPPQATPPPSPGSLIDWSAVVFDGPDQAVADRLGVGLMVVYEHRRALGIPSYQSRRREARMRAKAERAAELAAQQAEQRAERHAREDEVYRLHEEAGLTLSAIAERLGVSRARVGQILAKAHDRRFADRSVRRAAVRALIARTRRHLATAELRRRRLAHEAEIAARAQARASARVAAPLSARYAEVLRLADEEGLTYEAIGRRLGITPQRAHQIARKARARAGGMTTRR